MNNQPTAWLPSVAAAAGLAFWFHGFPQGLHIPVEQQGTLPRLPGLTLEIAAECSGLRFVLILFVFVSAFAQVVLPTISGQLIVTVLSVPVAMLANATGLAATSIGAYAIGPHVLTGPHDDIGKSSWAIALVAMIGFGAVLRSRTGAGRLPAPSRSPGRPGLTCGLCGAVIFLPASEVLPCHWCGQPIAHAADGVRLCDGNIVHSVCDRSYGTSTISPGRR